MRWTSVRTVAAPPERVFRAVADPEEFQKAIPGGSAVEYLTERRSGVGTKFRATRVRKGKTDAFDQEVTAFEPGCRIGLVNVTHGTVWDSVFEVREDGVRSILSLTLDAKTDRLLPRVMFGAIRGTVQKALDDDLDAVKARCER